MGEAGSIEGVVRDGPPPQVVERDISRLGDFMDLFCRKKHQQRQRRPVPASGCVEPYLGKKRPTLCPACTRLFLHGAAKRALCPMERKGPDVQKPNCAACEIQCFPDEYRTAMREVMSFSGWRLILRGRLDLIPGMLGFKK